MITEILGHLRNWFIVSVHPGTFRITPANITPMPENLKAGQHIRIAGSILNDGVYVLPLTQAQGLKNETFQGVVYGLNVPKELIALDEEITAWCASDAGAASGYTSESFGGYSYSKGTDASGAPVSWQGVFRTRLNPWRKV